MTNGVSGFPALPALSHSSARERSDDDDSNRSSFASVLAGAQHARAHPHPVRAEKKEGTSDLDAPDDTSGDSDATGDKADADSPGSTSANARAAATVAAPSIPHPEPVPNGIERSVAALDPALQEKLARVMTRMHQETGHDVQVGETYRTQSRQNALFAQGRSAPGEVVTWTQYSKHTQGRAVDLLVDNGAGNSDAYAALRRIATEEGLRTLGARDPGHLELPTAADTRIASKLVGGDLAQVAQTTENAGDSPKPGLVSVARIAQLAATARVAQVATTHVAANVARPAEVAQVASVSHSGVTSSLIKPATAAVSGSANSNSANSANTQSQPVITQNATSGSKPDFGGGSENRGGRKGNERDGAAYGATIGVGRHTTAQLPVADIGTEIRTSTAQRVAEVIATREDAPARPLSQIVMSVDTGHGTTDRIEVALRGNSLNATIEAADPRAAHAMSAKSDELVRALTRDGVDVESLRVRAAATAAAPITTDSSQRSSDSSGSRFERSAQWQQQQDRQRANDERRQQQREQRGGNES